MVSTGLTVLILGSITASILTLMGVLPVAVLLLVKSLLGVLFQFELFKHVKE